MYRDLTRGSILRSLLLFALPMLAGDILQQLYNIADTLIVSRVIGRDALAAVGSAYTLMIFLTSILLGLSMGAGALFSICRGRGDESGLRQSIVHAFGLIGVCFLGRLFFGDFLCGRYRFGFRGIVLPAVGADSASFCQFFLTKLTFFHEISSFSIQSFRIHGQLYPLSLPRTCPECKRNTKYLQIPAGRMRQISFLRDWHLQKGGKNDMILY